MFDVENLVNNTVRTQYTLELLNHVRATMSYKIEVFLTASSFRCKVSRVIVALVNESFPIHSIIMSDATAASTGHVAVAGESTKAKMPSSKKKATAAGAGKKHVVDHPKYSEMVHQALSSLKERGGSSRQAVLKYIMKNFSVGVDENVVNTHLKMALRAGVKNATLKQSKGSGATGSFRLGEEAKKKPKTAAVKKTTTTTKKAKATGTAKVKKTTDKSAKSPSKKMTKKASTKSATASKATPAVKTASKPKVAAPAKKSKTDKPKKAAGAAKKVKTDKPAKKSSSTAGTTKVVKKPIAKKTTTVAKKSTKPAAAIKKA